MKHSLLPLLALPMLAIAIVSCEPRAVSTPLLQGNTLVVRTSAAGVKDTIKYTDTLCVGDTARMSILLNGYFNTLTYFTASADTSYLEVGVEVAPEQMGFLAKGTDLDKGKLTFEPEQVAAFTATLRYIPRRAGTPKIDMWLASDAGEQYSPRYFYLNTQIK